MKIQKNSIRILDKNQNSSIRELNEFLNYKGLTKTLAKRNLKTVYNRSFLGWMWSVLHPLATLLIYSIVFGKILNGNGSVPSGAEGLKSFPMYLFSALVIWNAYSELSVGVMTSFANSINLRSRVYFPISCAVFASFISGFIVLGVEILVLVGAYLVIVGPSLTFFLVLPAFILAGFFGLGVGLMLAAANIRHRDVGHLYSVFLRLLFFMTPIIYPMNLLDGKKVFAFDLDKVLLLNPLTHFVVFIREVTYFQKIPGLSQWALILSLSSLSLIFGWGAFVRFSPKVIENS